MCSNDTISGQIGGWRLVKRIYREGKIQLSDLVSSQPVIHVKSNTSLTRYQTTKVMRGELDGVAARQRVQPLWAGWKLMESIGSESEHR